ncbi:MAG: hypothetical protein WC532_05860 [Candidatus Omnitrophota bacterium]
MINKLKIIFAFFILGLAFNCYAEEITLIYTGDTHAALYPCHCPKEPDGGISRRATLINKLRKGSAASLVLDSGGFFAGGAFDENAQNTQLDMQRTATNIRAMELMRYDAALVSNDEFNFGPEFLKQSAAGAKFAFLSCDVALDGLAAFIIKEISGIKVGIAGVTGISAQRKAAGIKSIDPKAAVRMTVEEIKKKNAEIIILLSGLSESDNAELAKEVPGIDIIISNRGKTKKEKAVKSGTALMLNPAWQGRKLTKVAVALKGRKLADYKSEDLRLSSEIADDPAVSAIRPQCFSDYDCRKKGMSGSCKNPGNVNAECRFSEPAKVSLTVVVPKDCRVCDTRPLVDYLKNHLPGLAVSQVRYPSPEADKLIKACGVKALPLYLLGKEVENQPFFYAQLKKASEDKGEFYMLKPAYTGISYLLERDPIKGRLDLFVSLFGKDAKVSVDAAKEFNPSLHFLVFQKDGAFSAAKGTPEIEESLRSVCVKKYYPGLFLDYIGCRMKAIDSTWWQDCAAGMDHAQIASCAKSEEGAGLLRENISLNQEAQVTIGPSYLMDNIEMFAIEGKPAPEDLRKVIKK